MAVPPLPAVIVPPAWFVIPPAILFPAELMPIAVCPEAAEMIPLLTIPPPLMVSLNSIALAGAVEADESMRPLLTNPFVHVDRGIAMAAAPALPLATMLPLLEKEPTVMSEANAKAPFPFPPIVPEFVIVEIFALATTATTPSPLIIPFVLSLRIDAPVEMLLINIPTAPPPPDTRFAFVPVVENMTDCPAP